MYHSITFKDGIKYTESKTAHVGDTSCVFDYRKGKVTAKGFVGGAYMNLDVAPAADKKSIVVTFPPIVVDTEIIITVTNDINTWEDWHLVPSSRPVFEPPEQKLTQVDVPGSNGLIDLSTSLTNYPIFQNRNGTIEFIVVNDYGDWAVRYSEIMDYLHGKTLKAFLEDDKSYYYEGRFYVENWTSNNDGTWSTISIGYSVEPYKLKIQSSTDDWLWDPFNFYIDSVQHSVFKDITINNADWTEFDFTGLVGAKPIVPKFTVSLNAGMLIASLDIQLYCADTKINWIEKHIDTSGTYQFYDYVMCDLTPASVIKMKMKGYATVSIDFISGGL